MLTAFIEEARYTSFFKSFNALNNISKDDSTRLQSTFKTINHISQMKVKVIFKLEFKNEYMYIFEDFNSVIYIKFKEIT